MESRIIMNKIEKTFAALLIVTVLVLSMSTQAAFAGDTLLGNLAGLSSADIYGQGKTEIVNIDGADYTYHYSYDDEGNRTVTVEDNAGNIDVLTYDQMTSSIFMNNEVIGTTSTSNDSQLVCSTDYEYVGSDSFRVSWAAGTSVAVVAGAIAIAVAGLGAGGVIAAMGSGSLSILASNSIGGMVYVDYYTAQVGMQIFDKFVWTFTASSGDSYGPFTFVPPTAYSANDSSGCTFEI